MAENSIEIQLTPEFQRKVKFLAKKYRQLQTDLQPTLEQLKHGVILGDQISGIGFTVMKVRLRNSDSQKGKSGGYRLIHWSLSSTQIVLIDIYPKSDQEDIEINDIRQIIQTFSTNSEESEA